MKEQGSLLLEVIVACAVLAVLSMAALPRALAIYREAALEYEMQCLLSDIRYVREISRTTQVWPKSMKGKAEQQLPSWRQAQMRFRRTGYTMLAGSARQGSHDFSAGHRAQGALRDGGHGWPCVGVWRRGHLDDTVHDGALLDGGATVVAQDHPECGRPCACGEAVIGGNGDERR